MTTTSNDSFGARARLDTASGRVTFYRLDQLEKSGVGDVAHLPYSIKVLLEAALRQSDGFTITADDVERIARWDAANPVSEEIPYKPARVILQDFTGVPSVVDLAALGWAATRSASTRWCRSTW
jgi:aconitate hydratase